MSNNFILAVLSLLFIFKPDLNSQITILDTIHTTENVVSWIGSAGNEKHYAWYESIDGNSEVLHSYNGIIDTLFIDPVYNDCNVREGLYATKNHVYWNIRDDFDSSCSRSFTWDENGIVEDLYGKKNVYDDFEEKLIVNDINTLSDISILDLEQQSLTPIHLETTTYYYRSSNIVRYTEDYIWVKAFKYLKTNDDFIGSAIIRYDFDAQSLIEIFFSSNFLHFNKTDVPVALAFTESLGGGAYNVYYYDGTNVQLIFSGNYIKVTTFGDGFFYKQNGTIYYWKSDGSINTIAPNAFLGRQTKCYIIYFASNFTFNTFYVTNGVSTQSYTFIKGIRPSWYRFIGNNIILQITDDVEKLLLHLRHSLSCLPCVDSSEDFDSDSVCNIYDSCEGGNDFVDTDGDYIPNFCDDDFCTTLFKDNFENNNSLNWTSGGIDAAILQSTNSPFGDFSYRIRDNSDILSSISTAALDFSQVSKLILYFDYKPVGMEVNENFYLELSKDGGLTYSIFKTWTSGIDFMNNQTYVERIEIPWQELSSTTRIRFRCNGTINSDEVFLDNIHVVSCESDCYINLVETTNDIIDESKSAHIGIETNHQIQANTQINYTAGEYLLFAAEFEVDQSATFHGYISPCSD